MALKHSRMHRCPCILVICFGQSRTSPWDHYGKAGLGDVIFELLLSAIAYKVHSSSSKYHLSYLYMVCDEHIKGHISLAGSRHDLSLKHSVSDGTVFHLHISSNDSNDELNASRIGE